MALVKAKMAFYHDAVGTRAQNEVFEVNSSQVCQQLEQAGYVQKVEGQEAQAFEQEKQFQQQVGQRNALTNEAVAIANHEHNMNANKHTQNVQQLRQQAAQQAQQQTQQQSMTQGQAQAQQAPQTNEQAPKAKKAEK